MECFIQTSFKTDMKGGSKNDIDGSLTLNGFRFMPISHNAYQRFVNALDKDEIPHFVSTYKVGQKEAPVLVRLLHSSPHSDFLK